MSLRKRNFHPNPNNTGVEEKQPGSVVELKLEDPQVEQADEEMEQKQVRYSCDFTLLKEQLKNLRTAYRTMKQTFSLSPSEQAEVKAERKRIAGLLKSIDTQKKRPDEFRENSINVLLKTLQKRVNAAHSVCEETRKRCYSVRQAPVVEEKQVRDSKVEDREEKKSSPESAYRKQFSQLEKQLIPICLEYEGMEEFLNKEQAQEKEQVEGLQESINSQEGDIRICTTLISRNNEQLADLQESINDKKARKQVATFLEESKNIRQLQQLIICDEKSVFSLRRSTHKQEERIARLQDWNCGTKNHMKVLQANRKRISDLQRQVRAEKERLAALKTTIHSYVKRDRCHWYQNQAVLSFIQDLRARVAAAASIYQSIKLRHQLQHQLQVAYTGNIPPQQLRQQAVVHQQQVKLCQALAQDTASQDAIRKCEHGNLADLREEEEDLDTCVVALDRSLRSLSAVAEDCLRRRFCDMFISTLGNQAYWNQQLPLSALRNRESLPTGIQEMQVCLSACESAWGNSRHSWDSERVKIFFTRLRQIAADRLRYKSFGLFSPVRNAHLLEFYRYLATLDLEALTTTAQFENARFMHAVASTLASPRPVVRLDC